MEPSLRLPDNVRSCRRQRVNTLALIEGSYARPTETLRGGAHPTLRSSAGRAAPEELIDHRGRGPHAGPGRIGSPPLDSWPRPASVDAHRLGMTYGATTAAATLFGRSGMGNGHIADGPTGSPRLPLVSAALAACRSRRRSPIPLIARASGSEVRAPAWSRPWVVTPAAVTHSGRLDGAVVGHHVEGDVEECSDLGAHALCWSSGGEWYDQCVAVLGLVGVDLP